jgi:hypothetical protein
LLKLNFVFLFPTLLFVFEFTSLIYNEYTTIHLLENYRKIIEHQFTAYPQVGEAGAWGHRYKRRAAGQT